MCTWIFTDNLIRFHSWILKNLSLIMLHDFEDFLNPTQIAALQQTVNEKSKFEEELVTTKTAMTMMAATTTEWLEQENVFLPQIITGKLSIFLFRKAWKLGSQENCLQWKTKLNVITYTSYGFPINHKLLKSSTCALTHQTTILREYFKSTCQWWVK